ncbi:hypothetical protein CC658_01055 [Salmonella enterica subsp. enterica serovar Koketime]|uniref:Uncharacterized protein n=2 Tax=Salmonella enterica I TaxID=59201 RepID=A0A5W2LN12_SALET|nr:hypothetical protein [Salmonella enterica subsp. enterica serovar Lattenkamp]EAM8930416.1 hypothetical protein [Salmonella enterica]EBR9058120.1 hypothetical protein [Salmonella enterica subsp. enterica serovar Koketime]ECJ3923991.1 hypothetical protein [Salmonella enterica subsp. enterica]EAR5593118.1 hypothetical protein [Salmonella enterica]
MSYISSINIVLSQKIIHTHYNINAINIFRAKENTPEAVYKKRNRERVMQISNMAHMSEPLL